MELLKQISLTFTNSLLQEFFFFPQMKNYDTDNFFKNFPFGYCHILMLSQQWLTSFFFMFIVIFGLWLLVVWVYLLSYYGQSYKVFPDHYIVSVCAWE